MYASRPEYLRQGLLVGSDADVYRVFASLVIAMIFLQKFAINIGDGTVGFNLGILWVGLGLLAVGNYVEFAPSRLALLSALLVAMMFSLGSDVPLRLPAFGLVVATYTAFVLQVRVSYEVASRCLMVFQTCMVAIAFIVLGQQVLQYTVGNQFWPNLDDLAPKAFLDHGFAYIRRYAWDSPYLEPNGIFFLEPSELSYYLAIAIALELLWFRNSLRLSLYVIAMLACLAGTGPLTLAITAPLWVIRLPRKLSFILIFTGAPIVIAGFAVGWLDPMLARLNELSQENSSAYSRIVLPLQAITDQIASPGNWFTGWGPGSMVKGRDIVAWPFSKLLYEYGLLTAVLFHAYLLVCMFDRALSGILSIVMLVPFLFFGSGFVSHANVMPLLLFGALLRIKTPTASTQGSLSYADGAREIVARNTVSSIAETGVLPRRF